MTEIPLSLLDGIIDISQARFQETLQGPNISKIGEFETAGALGYIANYIKSAKPNSQPMVVQFLGSPGTGKSKMAELTLPELESPVVLATDDYNIGTREDRRRIIADGGTSLQEKDFALLASHVEALRHLTDGEILYLPETYDPNTGRALVKGLTRKIVGPIKYVLIDGNFYVGEGGASNVPLDSLIYFHMSDRNRLHVRLTRDLVEGQMRGGDAKEILDQFTSRQKLQDEPFTLPFMDKANLIVEASPQFSDQKIKDFAYTLYQRVN